MTMAGFCTPRNFITRAITSRRCCCDAMVSNGKPKVTTVCPTPTAAGLPDA
jgi:hypothetical protein